MTYANALEMLTALQATEVPAVATDLSSHIADATDPHSASDYTQTSVAETITQPWDFQDKINIFAGQSGGWRDITGQAVSPAGGVTVPTWTILTAGSPFYAYKFAVNDQLWYFFHIPHDYAPGTALYLHAHWLSDGTSTNTVKWQFTHSFAKGFNQGNFNTTGTTIDVTQATDGTAFRHMVSESSTAVSATGLEVDGILMVHLKRITNGGTDNADSVFLLMCDVHYQANTLATKNRAPDFYA
jgi:hypothetical protein